MIPVVMPQAGRDNQGVIMKKKSELKICVGASAGGHMSQLLKLLNVAEKWPRNPTLCVTTSPLLLKKMSRYGRTYNIGECNRRRPFAILLVTVRCVSLIFKERPDVIITTGSLPIAILCCVAKLLVRTKIIWIDSVANINKLSMSGNFVRHFSDLFLTQWPHLANTKNNVKYVGNIV